MFQYEAEVLRVVDGDTMVLLIDLGFHVHAEATVRLARINTPEAVTGKGGTIQDPAKAFVMERCMPGSTVVVSISRQEKYGRWLADVFYKVGSRDRYEILRESKILNDELVSAGLATFYSGGKK